MTLKLRYLSVLVLMLMMVVLTLPALAQDELTQQVDLGDGYVISIPEAWHMDEDAIYPAGSFGFLGGPIALLVHTPTNLEADGFDAATSDVGTILVGFVSLNRSIDIERSDVEKLNIDGRTAAAYTFTNNNLNVREVVVELSDGSFGELSFVARGDGLETNADLINAILPTFNVAGAETPELSTSSLGAASTGSCTVSTDSADGAQLRVGPGTNRGAISFLPVNSDVTVTGRIELDDGSVWFQLDKDQAAPNGTAAAELWVSAASVDASGACDSVGDTSAPPVIPISVAPPSNSSPDNNGAPSGDQSANSTPGQLPSAGTWVMTINATTNASCAGYQNVPIPSTELFDSLSYTYAVSIINTNSFIYGGETFTRYPGSNSFDGMFTVDDSFVHGRFDVLSATSMRGELILSFELDGVQCSATNLVTTSHR